MKHILNACLSKKHFHSLNFKWDCLSVLIEKNYNLYRLSVSIKSSLQNTKLIKIQYIVKEINLLGEHSLAFATSTISNRVPIGNRSINDTFLHEIYKIIINDSKQLVKVYFYYTLLT